MRQRFGLILVSGLSKVAVDNFAECIEIIGRQVCDRSSEGMLSVSRYRPLVVRGYDVIDEVVAFERLLENPEAKAEPFGTLPTCIRPTLSISTPPTHATPREGGEERQ